MPTTDRPAFAYAPAAASWAKRQGAFAEAAPPGGPRRTNAHAPETLPLAPPPPPPPTSADSGKTNPIGVYFQRQTPQPLFYDFEPYSVLELEPLNPQIQLQIPDHYDGGSGSVSGGSGGEGAKPPLPFDNSVHDFYSLLGPLSSAGSAAASCSPPESTVSGTLSVPTVDGASVTETSAPLYQGEGAWSSSSSPQHKSGSVPPPPAAPPQRETEAQGEGVGCGGEYVCLVSRCEGKFRRVEELALHARTAHQHVCLWGDRGPCDSPGFATREELNWHVKREHLLVCPVLGCRDSAFPSPEVVDCHLKYVHGALSSSSGAKEDGGGGGSRPGGFLPPPAAPVDPALPAPLTSVPGSAAKGKELVEKMPESVDDRLAKISVSVGASKKRCREQMGAVLAKRMKRMNGKWRKVGRSPRKET